MIRFFECLLLWLRRRRLHKKMVVCWMFDEGQGFVAHDSSDNYNDGLLLGYSRWLSEEEQRTLRENPYSIFKEKT
jgi:hypothetical protein